jgi:hypothetical protein
MENISVQNINYIEVPENQEYTPKDQGVLNSIFITRNFGLETDYIENHVYSPSNEPLASNYNFTNYTVQNTFQDSDTYNQMIFTPESDVVAQGINQGTVNSIYYFYRKLFSSAPDRKFILKTISSDRTELRVILPSVSADDLQLDFIAWSNTVNTRNYYSDFVLNFSNNLTLIGVNIAFEQSQVPTLLIKLYEPLPVQFDVNDTFWLVEEISDPVTFEVTIQQEFVNVVESTQLRGPNITIDVDNKPNLTTGRLSLDDLRSTEVTSSFQQLISLFDETSADINIEYEHPDGSTAFENFVHFSSAAERLTNFRYKLTLIEGYQNDINALNTAVNTPYISQSKAPIQAKIDEIIKHFDNYEYFLYYASSSAAWPKINDKQPFQLYPVSSTQALTWFGDENYGQPYYGGQILSASVYDSNNSNYVWNTMPIYVTTDPQNAIIQNFISLLGQHYDYLWTYIKAITDIQSGDNRLEHGISKDLVAAALQSFGIKLYTTNRNTEDLYTALLGITPSGSLLPSTGSFLITNYVTASAQTTPDSDIVAETYKRIYHNLPYLLKAKGTYNGLRALMNCYGIPPTLLRVDEYGGNIKTTSSVETYFERFAYETAFDGTGSINVPWLPSMAQFLDTGDPNVMPDAIEFRLKTPGIPSSDFTEPVFQVGSGSAFRFGIQLAYSQSYNNFVSGTVNVPGSPYYQQRLGSNFQEYGLLRLVMSGSQGYCFSAPVYLPFFNNKWWSVLLYRQNPATDNISNNTYWLVAKNSIYTGEDGTTIGFQASSSIYVMGAISSSYNNSWNYHPVTPVVSASQIPVDAYLGGANSNNILAPGNITFTGSFQDLRYWRRGLELGAFNKHVLNPMSIQNAESSGSNDAYNDLVFRLGLGNDLLYTPDGFVYTGSSYNVDPYGNAFYVTASYTASLTYLQSIHPAVTGTVEPTASFVYPRNPSSYNVNLYNVGVYQRILSGSPTGIYSGSFYSGSYFAGSTTYDLFTLSFGINNSGSNEGTTYNALQTPPNVGAISPVDDKVRIIDQNLVPGDTLSPYISITQPQPITPDFPYMDVSLSPQNSIDYDIINQLGYWNIDEYIGDPREAQSREYQRLTTFRNYYFKKYISAYNLYDIMRLLSYFDSALFKMIADWVPGRAALSAGIVIRPNLLERVKTQRFEPEFYTGSNYTGSIPMEYISGGYGFQQDRIDANTDFENAAFFVPTNITFNSSSGIYVYEVTDQRPLFTGQYGGSEIPVYVQPTSSMVMEINKLDLFDIPDAQEIAIATTYSVLPFQPELNLVQQPRTTTQHLDVDYSSNPNVAVNNFYITERYEGGLTGSTAAPANSQLALALSQQSSSFLNAPVQDSNYTAYSAVNPRYLGSKLIARQYNTYSVGDISYGSDPVIDNNSIYFAYFKEVIATGSSMAITSSTNPYISNVYIKYLIDSDSNVLELTKQNKNLFPIQDIFNNQQAVVALFNNQQPSNQKFLDGPKNIYAGGFKYTPVLYNPLGETSLIYNLTASIIVSTPALGETGIFNAAGAPPGVISSPSISGSVGYFGFVNGGWPYFQSGYTNVFCNIYPKFNVNRTGTLTTTYINDAVNVYVEFTCSFQFTAPYSAYNFSNQPDAYVGGYSYQNVVSQSNFGSSYEVFGDFMGSTIVQIPANVNTVNFEAPPFYAYVYSPSAQTLFANYAYVNSIGTPTMQLFNGGTPSSPGTAAITRQATSQITQIISGAVDPGIVPGVFFYLSTGSTGTYRHLTGSDSMSVYFGQFIQSQSAGMISSGYELIDEVFQIQKGDLFRFYNKESNQWDRSFEREVKSIFVPTSGQYAAGQRMIIEFDENVDPRSCQDWVTDADNDNAYQISKFIVMKKNPDETNVTLDYQKQPGLTSDGILLPADAPNSLRDEAGNIVKQLKAQNLI